MYFIKIVPFPIFGARALLEARRGGDKILEPGGGVTPLTRSNGKVTEKYQYLPVLPVSKSICICS